jgi:ribosomal protein S27AE
MSLFEIIDEKINLGSPTGWDVELKCNNCGETIMSHHDSPVQCGSCHFTEEVYEAQNE